MPPLPSATDFIQTLQPWPLFAEAYWWDDPARPGLGCFGSGYNSWGVQTNQKYLGALAALAADEALDEAAAGLSREFILRRALQALRFSLATHISGDHHCSDGTQWGHTWISALGVERMMHGVEAINPHLTDEDRAGLARMLASEANWLLELPVTATKWASEGGNRPESNIWNGAILARTAFMYPDHPGVPNWLEKAHRFLVNGISIEADALDETPIAGRPLRQWHVGPNFFPNYALDHHGYLNVGYMVICLSNIAMFHFACVSNGWEAPPDLYHHAAHLWGLVKRLIFADGRLCRIGGDTRTRYCYCQDYLLPALAWCAHHLGDPHAPMLEAGCLELLRQEREASLGGSFLDPRLTTIRDGSPYYYTRLEADKAVVLSMNARWRRTPGIPDLSVGRHPEERSDEGSGRLGLDAIQDFEAAVAGGWHEPEHGAILHRSRRRIASWSWRASEPPQGMCLPPVSGHLAEWCENLAGKVQLLGSSHKRTVLQHDEQPLEGGFLTTGVMDDCPKNLLPEGWQAPQAVRHQYAVAALPDDRTMVVMEFCALPIRFYVGEVKGLKLNVPNDQFNGFQRTYHTAAGLLQTRADAAGVTDLCSSWMNVEGVLGAVGIYGADSFGLHQAGRRRASGYGDSLYYEELCFPCITSSQTVDPGTVVLDCASAVLSGADPEETRQMAAAVATLEADAPRCRAVCVPGADGREYLLVANFGGLTRAHVACPEGWEAAEDLVEAARLTASEGTFSVLLGEDQARLFRKA